MQSLNLHIVIIFFVTFLLQTTALAQSIARLTPSTLISDESVSKQQTVKLRSHEDTFMMFDLDDQNSLANHLDVQYSLKYLFGDPAIKHFAGGTDWEFSFTFTGEFDFFALSRDSGPVIGRRYNPGFLLERYTGDTQGLLSYTFSLEHESNGQSDNTLAAINSRAREFRAQYINDHPDIPDSYYLEMATDSVSRSTEAFVALGSKHRYYFGDEQKNCENDIGCVEFYSKFRGSFLNVEDDVFWDSTMSEARLLQHQGTQLAALSNFDDGDQSISITYRTGELFGGSPGKKNTFDISYLHKVTFDSFGKTITLPFVVTYHHGYLEELSRYSYKSSFFTIGFNFSQGTF